MNRIVGQYVSSEEVLAALQTNTFVTSVTRSCTLPKRLDAETVASVIAFGMEQAVRSLSKNGFCWIQSAETLPAQGADVEEFEFVPFDIQAGPKLSPEFLNVLASAFIDIHFESKTRED